MRVGASRTLQLEDRPSERVRVRWNSSAALRSLQWPQTLKSTVGSVTSAFCRLRSAAAAAMHSCKIESSPVRALSRTRAAARVMLLCSPTDDLRSAGSFSVMDRHLAVGSQPGRGGLVDVELRRQLDVEAAAAGLAGNRRRLHQRLCPLRSARTTSAPKHEQVEPRKLCAVCRSVPFDCRGQAHIKAC